MDTGDRTIQMGTTVVVTRCGYKGSIGTIYGRCDGSSLYNIWCEQRDSLWYGQESGRAHDLNLYPHEFKVATTDHNAGRMTTLPTDLVSVSVSRPASDTIYYTVTHHDPVGGDRVRACLAVGAGTLWRANDADLALAFRCAYPAMVEFVINTDFLVLS